jgi:spermidine synthase
MPTLAVGFQHRKVKVHVGDGFEFMKQHANEFDVIITDSSDPEGEDIHSVVEITWG